MRLVLSNDVDDAIVGREYVEGELHGEFIMSRDGEVRYRHPAVGELFANASRAAFAECVRAWERYRERVVAVAGEEAQLEVVEALRRDLAAHDALREGSFWTNVSQQAAWGHL